MLPEAASRVPRSPMPALDLREAVEAALTREGGLFAAGEVVVLRAMLGLGDDAAELYARLSLRVGEAFRVAELRYACATAEAVAELVAAGLFHTTVPHDRALPAFGADALRAACARLGLPRGGNRGVLEARLAGQAWCNEPVVLVAHRGLLARADRLGGFDRSLAAMERIVGVKWAEYAPTGGEGVFPGRAAMLQYERGRRGDWLPGEREVVARAGPPRWGRSAWRHAVEQLLAEAPPADALAGIEGVALLRVRALEAEGRRAEALAACRKGDPDPETALALARTGRRLAKALAESWPPGVPLREPPVRRLWLRRAPGEGARPLWLGGEAQEGAPIEAAVQRELAAAGRESIHAENWVWTSLFALVFRPLYWLPLPGRLPTVRRAGPVDLGTPHFYDARRPEADALLARLRSEGAEALVSNWAGERLEGLYRPELVVTLGHRLPGSLVAEILQVLLDRGWAAARGLPDLIIFSGSPARLESAVPAALPDRVVLAEIKGPTDAVRDGQRWWHDRLLRANIPLEIWDVSERK